MSTETVTHDDPPFHITQRVGIELPGLSAPLLGVVENYGNYPAPWVQIETSDDAHPIVFLGPGVIVTPAGGESR